jgi:RNA polymerase sigma-70 factor (sigma-E family)
VIEGPERSDLSVASAAEPTLHDKAIIGLDIEDLFRRHRLTLLRLAVLLVDDRRIAEDVVQDAFAALYAHQDRVRDPDAAHRYLRVSVLNAARSTLRRRRTTRGHTPADPGTVPGADETALLAAEHRELLTALKTLPARQREILILRYWGGLTEAEIATSLNVRPGTVKSAAHRGLARLLHLLSDPPT